MIRVVNGYSFFERVFVFRIVIHFVNVRSQFERVFKYLTGIVCHSVDIVPSTKNFSKRIMEVKTGKFKAKIFVCRKKF